MVINRNSLVYKAFLSLPIIFLVFRGVEASENTLLPDGCVSIQSSLERLACFDEYFKTPVFMIAKEKTRTSNLVFQPKILRMVEQVEKNRPAEMAGFLRQDSIVHQANNQQRIILSAPAIGTHPPRPLLVISCINNITRFQIGFEQALQSHNTRITLSLDGRSIGGDYVWKIIESGRLVDAGRGIPSINVLKKMSNYKRLTVQSDETLLNGLTFDISGWNEILPSFRKACHW